MIALRATLADLRRDERGAFALIALTAVLPLMLILFLIVNSGKSTFDNTRTQDAADMIAMAHATEAARAMNTLGMNHVSLAQNYTTAVNASSLHNTINMHAAVLGMASVEAGYYAYQTCKKYKNIPKIGAILMAACMIPATTYAAELAADAALTLALHVTINPKGALDNANDALLALTAQNTEIVDRFPDVIRQQGRLIAAEHKISDFYIDASCEKGMAESCDNGTQRQGMELPVTRNEPRAVYPRFCAALYFGTGGVDLGKIPFLSNIAPQMGSLAQIPAIHGSFHRRGFDINSGPMYGGSENDPYLPTHISRDSTMGDKLKHYHKVSQEKRLYDGLINAFQIPGITTELIAGMAWRAAWGLSTRRQENRLREAIESLNPLEFLIIGGKSTKTYRSFNPLATSYPFDQRIDSNMFTRMVELRTLAQCSSVQFSAVPGIDAMGGFLDAIGLVTQVEDFDLYNAIPLEEEGFVPSVSILPDIDDFHDDYNALVFALRAPNERWAGRYFRTHEAGYLRYAQGLVFNPDEISIYSQNWRARLVPADKMTRLSGVLNRMDGEVPESFGPYRTYLERLNGTASAGWADAVTR
ncbi:hypothetical protein SAMN05428995_1045 [Loktanella sp. DSM 29012]|uniref:TadE/TadG family type IV pilus assembly protein n=1 Tax=Loktanella sp. DSM 29012 TaxID=1881056 RepID=UPI0008D830BE|nr:hypothetical protein [Loktanella sp. DSM 29012]SEQ35593.1 hypothetical protein SAMN05428995_1045 [Loktanella sp. DSM 29012]